MEDIPTLPGPSTSAPCPLAQLLLPDSWRLHDLEAREPFLLSLGLRRNLGARWCQAGQRDPCIWPPAPELRKPSPRAKDVTVLTGTPARRQWAPGCWLALEQAPVGLLGWLDALAQGPSCCSQSPGPRTPGTGAGHSYHARGSAVELKSGACSRLCGLGQAPSPL